MLGWIILTSKVFVFSKASTRLFSCFLIENKGFSWNSHLWTSLETGVMDKHEKRPVKITVDANLQLDPWPERAIDLWPLRAKGLIVLVSPN